jgi:hypothetical protein
MSMGVSNQNWFTRCTAPKRVSCGASSAPTEHFHFVGRFVGLWGDSLTPPVNYHIKAVKILTQLIGKGK